MPQLPTKKGREPPLDLVLEQDLKHHWGLSIQKSHQNPAVKYNLPNSVTNSDPTHKAKTTAVEVIRVEQNGQLGQLSQLQLLGISWSSKNAAPRLEIA